MGIRSREVICVRRIGASTNSLSLERGFVEAYKREQSRIARRRLYPLTAFYTTYSLIVALLGYAAAPVDRNAFYSAGIPVWSLVEYLFIVTFSTALSSGQA